MDLMFSFIDIICDVYGYVIVIDVNNNVIYMFDKYGEVLKVY